MTPLLTNKLNFHATYDNKKLIIDCDPDEVAEEIAARFKINMENVTLWAIDKNKRFKVSPQDIKDFMKVEIVPKKNGQKTIPVCMAGDSNKKILDNMISKLRQNTSLTGQERKMLIEALEVHSTSIFSKRKLNQTDFIQPTAHKKIQVEIKNSKDSFAQTDNVNVTEYHVIAKDDAKLTLKRTWTSGQQNSDEIESLMAETFEERRIFILSKCPPVTVVKEQYPALFCLEQVKNELDRIFYPGKCINFLENMQKYSKHILHYGNDSDILERINRALTHAHTSVQKSYVEVVGSVFTLAKILEEDFGFIHLKDYPIRGKEILYPHIDASSHLLQDTFFNKMFFQIMVEEQHLCDACNFPEAILCIVALFFIFFMDYPKNCRRTLIAFEKLYLESDDTKDVDEKTSDVIKSLKREVKGASKGTSF